MCLEQGVHGTLYRFGSYLFFSNQSRHRDRQKCVQKWTRDLELNCGAVKVLFLLNSLCYSVLFNLIEKYLVPTLKLEGSKAGAN